MHFAFAFTLALDPLENLNMIDVLNLPDLPADGGLRANRSPLPNSLLTGSFTGKIL
jgi:hypothetical protein